MIRMKKLLRINLRLFDGAASGGSPAPAAGSEGTPGAPAENKPASLGKKQGEKVVYGKQPEPAEKIDQPAIDQKPDNAPKPEDRKVEFEKLIKGDFKDLFAETVQGIIDKRFKETKILEKQTNESKPILDVLMNKYGIQNGDLNALQKAIEDDDAYWEELADKEGLTVEQYKHKQKLESENRQLREATQNLNKQTQINEIYNGWLTEEQAIKDSGKYPDFNLKTECQNKEFVDMISRGIPLKQAYEVIHMEEIMSGVAKKVESNVAETIRANGKRPAENGTSSQSGVIYKNDVSALSKEDRAEIARRAGRGEKIVF
jgi:hypothetical protein